MANITAQMVKELREMTQAGMMDCKKALVEAAGEMEKAIEWLREKGLAAAAKKAGRIAAEGLVASYINDNATVGVIVEVNCETDFVANTDNFKAFCQNVAKHIAIANPADVDELLNQKFVDDDSKTITDLVSDATVSIGEKISIRRFARYETKGGVVESYIHMGGKIGVLLLVENDNPDSFQNPAFKTYYHDVALQVAAARPSYVRKAEVPTAALEKEREILRAQALNEGKPEKIVEKMVDGRIEKYYKEVCLLEQPFVKDPDQSISKLTDTVAKEIGANLNIASFERFERGEGIEKRQDNFAEEIAAQMAAKN
ncbi:MAG: translation elongation factor Ts [Candidatus Limiplasma sp.]|nr:translation elongation factor Ts [Clostridiales bacterium]MDY3817047.1 translation elongation factor Ts [Candidatus Limiplasma sp.]